MRHASPERGGGREADEGGLGEREAKRSLPQPARVGSADRSFSGKSRKTGEFGNFNLWFPNSSIDPAAGKTQAGAK